MLPTEQYSGDAVPQTPWTPPCWQKSPDQLIAEAKYDLFYVRSEVEQKALGPSGAAPAISGSTDQGANESEFSLNPDSPPEGAKIGRRRMWEDQVRDLYATEPLAATPAKADSWSPAAQQANPNT